MKELTKSLEKQRVEEQVKDTILNALRIYRGDDLERARAFWGGLSDEQMSQEHGNSGRTKAQYLADYEEHADRVDAAIEWVEGQ